MISSFVPCLYSTVPQYFEDMGYLSPTVKFLCRILEPDNADKSLTWNIPSPRGICIGCNSLLWVLSCLSDKLHGTGTTHNILRSLTLYRAVDKLVYHVITKIFDRIRIYLNSSAYHIRKTNKYYTFNVFQSVTPEMSYFVLLFTRWEKLEEIRICYSSGMFVLLRRHRKSS